MPLKRLRNREWVREKNVDEEMYQSRDHEQASPIDSEEKRIRLDETKQGNAVSVPEPVNVVSKDGRNEGNKSDGSCFRREEHFDKSPKSLKQSQPKNDHPAGQRPVPVDPVQQQHLKVDNKQRALGLSAMDDDLIQLDKVRDEASKQWRDEPKLEHEVLLPTDEELENMALPQMNDQLEEQKVAVLKEAEEVMVGTRLTLLPACLTNGEIWQVCPEF